MALPLPTSLSPSRVASFEGCSALAGDPDFTGLALAAAGAGYDAGR